MPDHATPPEPAAQPQDAHAATLKAHDAMRDQLDFSDTDDFDDARRGWVASIADGVVRAEDGRVTWDLRPYAFLDDEASPPTVNPSLWRLARLNHQHGLYQVTEGIYQVRGYDLANITFIETDSGLVVIDPLTFEEAARASLALYTAHRGARPIRAVIYSHSHPDHYGGVYGVISDEDVRSGRVAVIAPDKFMEEVVSETVLAGLPMRRRAQFQFGTTLAPGVRSHVDSGLGKAMGRGRSGLIPPTVTIRRTGERMTIDGLEIVFQMTPGTEAPAEMNFHFPALRALNMAENACHTMHNLCPLRGAKTRDALAWASYIDEAIDLYAAESDVVFAQHHWPVWGTAKIVRFMSEQRDLYRYLHDQTLRWMSHGLTAREICERLLIPSALASRWHGRGYYGAVVHNVNAIYAHYMGPYDGNPAHLDPLAPVAAAKKTIEYMGGLDAVMARAHADFAQGEFRWVVQAMNHAVFADPSRQDARRLGADAMEQLGYQAESSTWRNAYLLGARELREGLPKPTFVTNVLSADVVACLPMAQFFDYLAIRVKGEEMADFAARIDWVMTDEGTTHRLSFSHGALHHRPGSHGNAAMATIHATRASLSEALRGRNTLLAAIESGAMTMSGDADVVRRWLGGLDAFDPMFAVVEP